jgi:hypothetical protein
MTRSVMICQTVNPRATSPSRSDRPSIMQDRARPTSAIDVSRSDDASAWSESGAGAGAGAGVGAGIGAGTTAAGWLAGAAADTEGSWCGSLGVAAPGASSRVTAG